MTKEQLLDNELERLHLLLETSMSIPDNQLVVITVLNLIKSIDEFLITSIIYVPRENEIPY